MSVESTLQEEHLVHGVSGPKRRGAPGREGFGGGGKSPLRRTGPHLAVAAFLLATCVVVLLPFPLEGEVLGHPLSDVADHYWGHAWWSDLVRQGRLPLVSHRTHLPEGAAILYVDPLGALLSTLLAPLGSVAAFELAVLIALWGTAMALYAVVWRGFGDRGAGVLAGMAGAVAPYLNGLVHSGLTEFVGLFFPVLFVWLLMGAVEGRRTVLGAGLALCGCTLQSYYYGAFGFLLTALAVAGPHPWRRARRALGVAVVGAVGSAPPVGLLVWSLHAGNAVVGGDLAPGWSQATPPAVDLSLFLRPGHHYFPDTPTLGNPGILQVHYLGWVLVALGVWGWVRHPRLRPHRWMIGLFALCGLGPTLAWGGEVVTLWGKPVPLPLALLYEIPGSPWRFVHHPYRMAGFLLPVLALGLGAAVLHFSRRGRLAVGAGLVVEAWLLSPAVWPQPVMDVQPPPIYTALAEPGGVLDWPPDATTWNRRYVAWQVRHDRPVPYGLNTFLPEPWLADPLVRDLLGALEDLRARSRNRDVPGAIRLPDQASGARSRVGTFGVRWLVVHPQALSEGEWLATRAHLLGWLGEPDLRVGDERAWYLPERPFLPGDSTEPGAGTGGEAGTP